MLYYRLYHLRRGHFVRCDEIHADDDAAAEEAARALTRADTAELWRGSHRIAVLPSWDGAGAASA